MGCTRMKKEQDFPIKRIMEQAGKDLQYQQLLQYYEAMDRTYRQLSDQISQENLETLEQFMAASEAVYYRFAQIAYQCGKRSKK